MWGWGWGWRRDGKLRSHKSGGWVCQQQVIKSAQSRVTGKRNGSALPKRCKSAAAVTGGAFGGEQI
jgi:hypothetical protein